LARLKGLPPAGSQPLHSLSGAAVICAASAPARNENHNLVYSNAALPQQNIVPEE
jgi:hypothetical protein